MFKVKNKNARMTSLTSFWCFIVNVEHITVSIVNFEQVNVSWAPSL